MLFRTTSSLWCTRTLRAPVSIREDPFGSIAGFERGRGTVIVCYPSLLLWLIGESFFGAAIHNLLHLRCSLQSGRYLIFFSFQSGMGRTYDSYSLMWQLGRAIEVIGLHPCGVLVLWEPPCWSVKIPLAPLLNLNEEEEQRYPSLPLCLTGESFFGAAIHNLLLLLRSLQSILYHFFPVSVCYGLRTNLIPWCNSLTERLKLLDLQFGGPDYSSSTVLPYVFQTVKEFWLLRSLTIRLFLSSTTSKLKKKNLYVYSTA